MPAPATAAVVIETVIAVAMTRARPGEPLHSSTPVPAKNAIAKPLVAPTSASLESTRSQCRPRISRSASAQREVESAQVLGQHEALERAGAEQWCVRLDGGEELAPTVAAGHPNLQALDAGQTVEVFEDAAPKPVLPVRLSRCCGCRSGCQRCGG